MDFFVSYAQNYEDVMLWRALKQVKNGFYVDVGANDPKFDSVTQAFYERGWRGINIEPAQDFYDALCRERPRDINLPYAVGAAEGELTFYEVPETGISSAVASAVYENRFLDNRTVIEKKVPVTTLNKILVEYVHGEIHFLKIDVEGYEKPVLEGLDLSKWRPWVLVVETTIPNSPVKNDEFNESNIISSNYSFVYFDGLNRYYAANEHPELHEPFSTPPNVFDYFIPFKQIKQNEEIEALHSKNELAEKNIEVLQHELEWTRKEIDTLRSEKEGERKEIEFLREELTGTRKEIDTLRSEKEGERKEIEFLREELEWERNDLISLREDLSKIRKKRDEFQVKIENFEKQEAAYQAATHELSIVRTELELKRVEADELKRQYINILYSLSYRITAPLRNFYVIAQKVQKKLFKRTENLTSELPIAPPPQSENPTIPIIEKDEQYFINFFQDEIKRRQSEQGDPGK